MGLLPGNIKFNYQGFAATFILVKVRRYYTEFISNISDKQLLILIEGNQNMLDVIGREKFQALKIQARSFKPLLEQVSLDMLYGWVPSNKKTVIEGHPDGKKWYMAQLAEIKKFLLA